MSLSSPTGRPTQRRAERPTGRPFSPFLRLVIGVGATALAADWARFQADLSWAALPVGAGAVITLASVTRGVQARRSWRKSQAAAAAQAETAAIGAEGLPLPAGRPDALAADTPRTVQATRRETAPAPTPAARLDPDASRHPAPAHDDVRHDTHTRNERHAGDATPAPAAHERPTKEVSR